MVSDWLYFVCERVHLGFMHEFLNTSCMTNLAFLTEAEDSPDCTLLNDTVTYKLLLK